MADVKRPYRTTIRRGDAPKLICAAGYRLFSDKGYLATSIEDIAAEAGVARPTIFTAVGPKATILRLVVDHALAGDDAPVPIAQRPWWREAIEEPDPCLWKRLPARRPRQAQVFVVDYGSASRASRLIGRPISARLCPCSTAGSVLRPMR